MSRSLTGTDPVAPPRPSGGGARDVAVRVGAASVLLLLTVVPPVLLIALVGRPWPDWSTLSDEISSGTVSTDTTMRVAAALFVLIWVWALVTIGREAMRILGSRRAPVATRAGAVRPIAAPPVESGPAGPLVRLVRIALLGTVTTAATVAQWSSIALEAAAPGSPVAPAGAAVVQFDAAESADATSHSERPRASAAADVVDTVVADGRQTPLSLALDLGDETLRQQIVDLNPEWSGGPFEAGTVVRIPVRHVLDTSVDQAGREAPPAVGAMFASEYIVQPNDGWIAVVQALWGPDEIDRWAEHRDELVGQEVAPGVVVAADDTIHPGWTFHHPADPASTTASPGAVDDGTAPVPGAGSVEESDVDSHVAHVVVEGDTLHAIADQHLGEGDRWPLIWEDNAGRDMGDGRTFDDPNLILPGWEIDVPSDDSAAAASFDAAAPDARLPSDRGADVTGGAVSGHDAGEGGERPADERADRGDGTKVADPDDVTDETPRPVPGDATGTAGAPGRADRLATRDAVDESLADVTDETPRPGFDIDSGGVDPSTETPRPDAHPADHDPASLDAQTGNDVDEVVEDDVAGVPAPIRLEHAALISAGLLTLVGVRRRRRLRQALPRGRAAEPGDDVAAIERRLRSTDPTERAQRLDVAIRAAARQLIETGVRIGFVLVDPDGEVTFRLTGDAIMPLPWNGGGSDWSMTATTPIEMFGEEARQVGHPSPALVQIGVDARGRDVLVDLEAALLTVIEGEGGVADEVLRAVTVALSTSATAEVAHLVTISLPSQVTLGHPNVHRVRSVDDALELADDLVRSPMVVSRSPFDLRTLRTGGEMWEPAIAILTETDAADLDDRRLPAPERSVGILAASDRIGALAPGVRLAPGPTRWTLSGFGTEIEISPVGVTQRELAEIAALLDHADRPIESFDVRSIGHDVGHASGGPTSVGGARPVEVDDEPFEPSPHRIVVGVLGPVTIADRDGRVADFERSKTIELIAWLATHRARATRSGARTALWELDVRDATFANVVSEARRGLGRLVDPPDGDEWLARTMTDDLPLHELVVTDADLVRRRLDHARLAAPSQSMEILRPAVEMIRDVPFAGTSYLWPDADGITSNLVLLATSVAGEYAGHALSLGDVEGVFWATGYGLTVLPGHEELIALRMRAHARAGDLAGVRQEWESYERVIVGDSWSDGEPAPKLVELRRELFAHIR